jgi:hypothetical protein
MFLLECMHKSNTPFFICVPPGLNSIHPSSAPSSGFITFLAILAYNGKEVRIAILHTCKHSQPGLP